MSIHARAKRLLFLVASLVVATALGLTLIEIGLRAFLPTSDQYLALTPGREAVFTPQHQPGVQGPSLYKVNSMGVRAREWSEDRASERRILAVGGSTTECLVNDQSRVWTHLVEESLGRSSDGRTTWVGNNGQSGFNTRHHVQQMKHLLDVYDPDDVVLLAGVNDLSMMLKHGENYDPEYLEKPENVAKTMNQTFEVFPGDLPGARYEADSWFKKTRLWRLMRVIKYQIVKLPNTVNKDGSSTETWRQHRREGTIVDELPSLEKSLQEYETNLKKIADLVAEYGAHLLLMTQPVVWRADLSDKEEALLWMGGLGDFQERPGSTYYAAGALEKGMDAYNQRLLDVCEATGATCVDLAGEIPKTTEFFWDDCHFTDKAQGLIAGVVASALQTE